MSTIPKYPGKQNIPNVNDMIAFRKMRASALATGPAEPDVSASVAPAANVPTKAPTLYTSQPPVFSPASGLHAATNTNGPAMAGVAGTSTLAQARNNATHLLHSSGRGRITSLANAPFAPQVSPWPTINMNSGNPGAPAPVAVNAIGTPTTQATNATSTTSTTPAASADMTTSAAPVAAATSADTAASAASPVEDTRSTLQRLYDEKLASLTEDETKAREMLANQNNANDRRASAFAGQYGYGAGSGGAAALSRQADIADKESMDKLLVQYGDKRRGIADQQIEDERTAQQNEFTLRNTIAAQGGFDDSFEKWVNAHPGSGNSMAERIKAYNADPANTNNQVDSSGQPVSDGTGGTTTTANMNPATSLSLGAGVWTGNSNYGMTLHNGTTIRVNREAVDDLLHQFTSKYGTKVSGDERKEMIAYILDYKNRNGHMPSRQALNNHYKVLFG